MDKEYNNISFAGAERGYSEQFAEYIVKTKLTPQAIMLRIVIVLGVFLCFSSVLFIGVVAITLTALMIYFAWYVFSITSVEYEYSLVNADLTIDKIMGQRKRKRVAEFDFKKAEIMAYVESEHLKQYEQRARIRDFSSRTNSSERIGVIFADGKETVELVFEPNDRIVDAIRRIRPGIVKLD